MAGTFTIDLNKPMASVKILTAEDAERAEKESKLDSADAAVRVVRDLEKEKAETVQLYRVLSSLVDKVSEFYDELLARHKEEIAKFSVEIARKILMQKVQKGDYQIEAIVKEAVKSAPVHQDVVVRLNPADLAQLRKLKRSHAGVAGKDDSGSVLSGIEFIADSKIGPAECLVETPKGIVKSLIDEHLARISEALGLAVAGTETDPQ
jgi:flagellar biosynthesis/type III secretory pathway protein FliH